MEFQRMAPEVLVVDDDAALARMLRLALRGRGYDVNVAGDGASALAAMRKHHPDLIVLDLEMPVMDGRCMYRELRARGDNVPVLICSAHGARAAQRELGADGYIDKPFNPDDLVRNVEELL